MSARPEIISLVAPVADAALDQLADVLVDCVEGGASVNFLSPFSRDQAMAFFRKVAASVAAAGYRALMAGVPVYIPGWRNRILAFGVRLTPRKIITAISKQLAAPA